jgi:error-prone DNA polymerase
LPDVDIDISSSRREEVLAWAEKRFTSDGEAMVTNRYTYRLPLAVQDLGRALGLPPELRDRITRRLGRDYRHLRPHRAREAEAVFTEVLGNAPAKEVLLSFLEKVEKGHFRHFTPHSGGVIASRYPLKHYSPLQRSTGGIRLIQFDKDDAEALGLIKLDLLGLRMLSVLERARDDIHRLEGLWLDLADLPDVPALWRQIQEGDTLGLFQIESPAQARISIDVKPETLTDLAHQIALVRPGPIQSGTVHPYIRRRQGKEPITYPHPALEPVLEKSYGVVLFQEDVLRIAVHFAGYSWSEADTLRKRASKAEEESELELERQRFIEGAIRTTQATRNEAEAVFAMIAAFKGYGFAESHAWAFAQHAYTSAYLRHYYPAEYFAAVLTEQPGMWPRATIRQELRCWEVPVLPLDINTSSLS